MVTIREIARARHIPERFLEAILLQLKHHGIAHSVRGKAGGYVLARPASQITVADIVRIFDTDALRLAPPPIKTPRRRAEHRDVFKDLWQTAERCLSATLDGADFQALAVREARESGLHTVDFVI